MNVLLQRRDEVLAKTDPFDLAQAVDRYVCSLDADRIRAVLLAAYERMGAYYRSELSQALAGVSEGDAAEFAALIRKPWSPEQLQRALAGVLKSNLRAIPIFGPAFCDGVLEYVPADRAVAIGEERAPAGARAAVIAGVALALLLAGAAGEHYVAGARASASYPSPGPAMPPPPRAVANAVPATPVPIPTPTQAPTRAPTVTPSPSPIPASPQTAAPTMMPTSPPSRRPTAPPSLPPARGVATIRIPSTPTPEPTSLDVSDMPNSYDNATPLPKETAVPASAPEKIRLVTPTPKPVHQSWLHRSVMHLDPFKPRAQATP